MKKKVACLTIVILVLLSSVIRTFGLPEEDIYETQPTTHLVGEVIYKIVRTVLIWKKI
ncbi:TPA: hypothetical protein TZW69_001500 [Streptococcus suis]|uniref:Uncharacterized protein n=1 Tax=Streptococcus suis TaxID=1307 RepID=A0A7T1L9J1_STRSU|nr:hypothetical protein [Streptococcus suis]MCQ8270775.1 hypothetical protein [Streptococcus suis]MCQ8785471.1 hypothetical protein [Streptococcus suis]MDW8720085.1 hypothetical protein [Streptococcus suis]MDY7596041.1 hypothetical protein [Streptococcus suis]MDY7601532.1 hypothetical protein [Streptococcus suis]